MQVRAWKLKMIAGVGRTEVNCCVDIMPVSVCNSPHLQEVVFSLSGVRTPVGGLV